MLPPRSLRQAGPSASLLALALLASGCFSGASHPVTPQRPTIRSFTASPTSVAAGGAVTLSWSVTGAESLSIAPGVGAVTGTSVSVAPTTTTTYVLTATSAGGTSTASVNVAVIQPPASLAYTVNPAAYVAGTAIAPNTPSYSGGVITSWSVSPALPAGLSLGATTGIISGTPTAATPEAAYTVTGTNAAGTATVDVTIRVDPGLTPPANLTYATNPAIYTVGTPIPANPPSSTGGAIATYAVSPALPAGLSLDAATGVLSGTPTAPATQAVYTVTGTNAAGSTTAALTLTVDAVVGPPANLTYSANPATYTVGSAIPANTPSSTGGAIVSYTVTPPLPAGLSLDAATGVITGTPTAETAQALYTVTGTNPQGSATVALDITVGVSPTPVGFSSTGSMATTREYHTATRLADGKVLVVGGFDGSNPVRTAEVYDPATGLFTPTTGSMATPRQNHSAALLADGKVLVAGGLVNNNLTATATAEIYDPATGTFSSAATSMPDARSDFTATTLPGGKVLVAGGAVRSTSTFLASAALYDPATRAFSATGALRTGRAAAVAVLLQGGKVLVAGGAAAGTGSSVTYLASAELYDVSAGTFAATGPMPAARVADTATALVVSGSPSASTGKVLVTGGATPFSLATADLYDPAGGTFAATGSMAEARSFQTASLLPGGQVLVAGGTSGATVLATAELYDPVLGQFAASGHDMTAPRYRQTATELQDGRVLVVGGRNANGVLSSAELYTPVP